MSENQQINIKYIKEFLTFLIRDLTELYDVNEDGYIIFKKTKEDEKEELVTITTKDKKYHIVLPDEILPNDPNAILLNPFVESLQLTKDREFLYQSLAVGLNFKVQSLLRWTMIMYQQNEDEEAFEGLDNFTAEFLAVMEHDFDEKFEQELKELTKDPFEFLNVYYIKQKKAAKFRSLIFEDESLKDYKVRKKTIKYLRKFLMFILEIKNEQQLEEFMYQSNSPYIPQFDSILNTYYKIYERANKYFAIVHHEVDLNKFKMYIENLENMYEKAKWLGSGPVTKAPIEKTSSMKDMQKSSLPLPQSSPIPIPNLPPNVSSIQPIQPILTPIGVPQQPIMQQPINPSMSQSTNVVPPPNPMFRLF